MPSWRRSSRWRPWPRRLAPTPTAPAWRRCLALRLSARAVRHEARDHRRSDGRHAVHEGRRDRRRAGSGVAGQRQRDDGDGRHQRRPGRALRPPEQRADAAAAGAVTRGTARAVHHRLSRRAGQRPAPDHEQVRRVERVQRELAEPRARVAADDRSPVRQGHQRVHRHGAARSTRSWPTACWSRRPTSATGAGGRTGSSRCRSRRG